jgi:hypothetical protein
MNSLPSALPQIEGGIDEAYLSAALTRAGRSIRPSALMIAGLTDGRQSSPVLLLKSGAGPSYVLKIFAREDWRSPVLGDGNIEACPFRKRRGADVARAPFHALDRGAGLTRCG